MSDEDLDRDWKPNGRRPQSTMAKSFSAALDDMFKMDNSLADLDAAVSEKKFAVVSQTSELEALEARLRATEERLKANGLAVSPRTPSQRVPLDALLRPNEPTEPNNSGAPAANDQSAQQTKQSSRPATATRPGAGKNKEDSYMPGELPPTPGISEDDEEGSDEEGSVEESSDEEDEVPRSNQQT